jgi:hypothetical protein
MAFGSKTEPTGGVTGNSSTEQAAERAAELAAEQSVARRRKAERRLRLGVFTTLRLYAQGRRDGRRGLPAQSEPGIYTSPFIARELDEHQQFCATSRLRCEQKLTHLRQSLARLDREQALLETTIANAEASLKQRRALFEPNTQTPRNTSEQKLDIALLHNRRLAEFESSLTPLNKHANSARSTLDAQQIERAAILAAIKQEEHLSRWDRERHARRTERKITAYWQAAFTTYRAATPYERLPLHSPFRSVPQLSSIEEREPSWD